MHDDVNLKAKGFDIYTMMNYETLSFGFISADYFSLPLQRFTLKIDIPMKKKKVSHYMHICGLAELTVLPKLS